MAKFSNVNKINDGTSGGHIEAIWWLKETLVAAGWTVLESSDGTTHNASGDQWTAPSDVAPASSWLRIEDPASRRELLFKHAPSANDDNWYVGYSSLDKFVTGTPDATTTPTATDEAVLWGTAGQNHADMFSSTSQNHRIHVVADSTPVNGVYPFWILTHLQGGTSTYFFMACDPMLPNSHPAEPTPAAPTVGDADPCVFIVEDGPSGTTFSGLRSYNYTNGWHKYNYVDQNFVKYYAADWATAAGALANNPYTLNVEGFPIHYARYNSVGTDLGHKGLGAFVKWAGNIRTDGETVNLNSGAYIHWNDLLLPWEDNTAWIS